VGGVVSKRTDNNEQVARIGAGARVCRLRLAFRFLSTRFFCSACAAARARDAACVLTWRLLLRLACPICWMVYTIIALIGIDLWGYSPSLLFFARDILLPLLQDYLPPLAQGFMLLALTPLAIRALRFAISFVYDDAPTASNRTLNIAAVLERDLPVYADLALFLIKPTLDRWRLRHAL